MKKVMTVLFNIIIALIILSTTAFIFVTLSLKNDDGGAPKILGVRINQVISDSMSGDKPDNFSKGDMLLIEDVDTDTLKKGDIITFWDFTINDDGTKALNSHRIVKLIEQNSEILYKTKGDNNKKADVELVRSGDIVGIYKTHIKGLGNVLTFLQSKWGFFACLVAPMILFFLWRLIKLVMLISQYRVESAKEKFEEELAKREEEKKEEEGTQPKTADKNNENNEEDKEEYKTNEKEHESVE